MSLYALTNDVLSLQNALDDFVNPETGEISEEFIAKMEECENKVTDKADNYGKLLAGINGNKAMIQAEIDSLKAKLERLEKHESSLLGAIELSMERLGKERLDGVLFAFSFRKSKATIIDDETKLPEKFRKEEVIPETVKVTYPKAEILKALEAGEEVPGAHIEHRKSVVFK